jgi:DNA-binding transcriptional ArsR family regulator
LSIQTSIRRVKTIFSVIASPSRLEVLKILNTKGPMTYSELKTLAGFKAKKESGKFAYHLRKLLRQNLIAQNRAERKYMLTTLGRLVLNSAKQIEEQALLESGRLFVRSSRHKMEEFTTDRIVHSLVSEAGMPVELAQRVASEAESRIYKFQTAYLTAPLIRELVNSILIEEGLEEYRHRLSRLGMPVYDVTEEFERIGHGPYGIESLTHQTASSVLSEYLLLIQLPRDIADSHLSGDIHISNVGHWSLKPDTLFVNIAAPAKNAQNLEGKFPFIPKMDLSKKDEFGRLLAINYLLSREAGRDVYYIGFSDFLPAGRDQDDLARLFSYLTYSFPQNSDRPKIMFEVDMSSTKGKLTSILNGYGEYVKATPVPAIGLALTGAEELGKETVEQLVSIVRNNGLISLNRDGRTKRSAFGIAVESVGKAGPITLDSISINMPRIALDTQNDEVYFRARTRLQLENAVNALKIRRKLIETNIKRGLLPSLNLFENMVYSESPFLRVNLTGLNESLLLVKPNASPDDLVSMAKETLDSAEEYFQTIADGLGSGFSIILTSDESALRFVQLDRDKYGRSKVKGLALDRYAQGTTLSSQDLNDKTKVSNANSLLKIVQGGVLTKVMLELENKEDVSRSIAKASTTLDYCLLVPLLKVCLRCGRKDHKDSARCEVCGGPMVSVAA